MKLNVSLKQFVGNKISVNSTDKCVWYFQIKTKFTLSGYNFYFLTTPTECQS